MSPNKDPIFCCKNICRKLQKLSLISLQCDCFEALNETENKIFQTVAWKWQIWYCSMSVLEVVTRRLIQEWFNMQTCSFQREKFTHHQQQKWSWSIDSKPILELFTLLTNKFLFSHDFFNFSTFAIGSIKVSKWLGS